MSLDLGLSGRVALVTGGVRGVGLGITRQFLAAGATVVTCARSAAEPIEGATHVQCDVRDPEAVAAMIEQIVATKGSLDVLVNNAGGAPFAMAADASPNFHDKITALNLLSTLLLMQVSNRLMQTHVFGGAIVNVSSATALRPSPGTAAYGAAKAGLLNLTRSLAVEWAPRVRVNAITAGMIRTEQAHLHYGDEEGIARVSATVPLGRLALPVDIANACLFLASPLASYVSGADLLIHGGGERPAFLDAATTNQAADKPAK